MTDSLTVETMVRVAEEVVRGAAPGYEVVGVKLNDREADYAEVFLRARGCNREPCLLTVGVFRSAGEDTLRQELSDSLRRRRAQRRAA